MALGSIAVWLEAAAKAPFYIGLLLAIGTCAVRWFVLPHSSLDSETRDGCERRLARVLQSAAAIVVLALLLRLLAHTFAAFGAEEWLAAESLKVIAGESRWGTSWRLQLLCAGVALASALLVPGNRAIGWPAATAAGIACCFATPLLGHAAGSATRVAFHGLHVLGGAVWIGSLGAIVLAGPRAALLRKFTPVALTGASLILLAGLVMAVEYVGRVSGLWSTVYGRVLLLKLTIFAGVLVCGYLNWRTWGGGLTRAAVSEDDGRLALVESLLALGIVIVTALLTELEHP